MGTAPGSIPRRSGGAAFLRDGLAPKTGGEPSYAAPNTGYVKRIAATPVLAHTVRLSDVRPHPMQAPFGHGGRDFALAGEAADSTPDERRQRSLIDLALRALRSAVAIPLRHR
jgi:hypothetical protein